MAGNRKLNRPTDQRVAVVRGLTTDLLWYGRIETTEARAKEVRKQAEKLITLGVKNYADVVTELAAERYFKPIYNWHASRGLIYGSDNEGRGTQPTRYLDYFQTEKWFTAPGNDAPSRGSSFTQTKVSSSVAHLYCRPRTWLEAFHSMGWDANGALLTHQLDHHIIAGGNLLCMHGLYYSTHGGWWEWAPPCFHFRMPYWPHMKLWLKYAERMCFLLSQGDHVCDIALMYPTETMQAVPGTDASSTFAVSEELSSHGLDYDFIDYKSLQSASVKGSSLEVAGESYKVLVFCDTKAMHRETMEKVLEFRRAGGIVLAAGEVMPEIPACGALGVHSIKDISSSVKRLLNTDFRTGKGEGRVLHRRIGDKDVYMLMNVENGDSVYFRSRGMLERWNAMDGTSEPLPVLGVDEEGTWIRYEGESGNSMLAVFSPGEPVTATDVTCERETFVRAVEGDWEISVIPTMNNRWGDFRLPASDGVIGVEAREFKYVSGGRECVSRYGFGPYMETCEADCSAGIDDVELESLEWRPYIWSWQYGVPDSPGSQGWHGLKAKVDSRFLILDKGAHQFFRTGVLVPKTGYYRLVSEGVTPARILVDGKETVPGEMNMRKGWHTLLVAYAYTKKTEYRLEGMRGSSVDRRDRGMVMFYPASSPEPGEYGMYDNIVASKWYGTEHLAYDAAGSPEECVLEFETAPGTRAMHFSVNGRLCGVTVDGVPARFLREEKGWRVDLAPVNPGVCKVRVSGRPVPGCPGAAFIEGPVKLDCGTGKVREGDWSQYGALRHYSGILKYSKDIDIAEGLSSVTLDLGEVDATCEVSVNGKQVGILIGKPYSVDITAFVRPGANRVEVTVCSSLSNHYCTIPSPYRGKPHAGLIGPVRLLCVPSK